MRGMRFGPQVLAFGVAAMVLAVLVWPHHLDGAISRLADSALLGAPGSGSPVRWALEDLGNIALFAPLGFTLAWWTRRPALALLAGAAVSLSCEFTQHWIPTRVPSLLDVGWNVLGTAAGVALAVAVGRARARSPRASV